jgi:hypothetical protein
MKTQEILSIVALSLLGLCLLCGLAKMAMKKDSAKKNCDKACSMAVFATVVLLAISQLIGETDGYEEPSSTPASTPSPGVIYCSDGGGKDDPDYCFAGYWTGGPGHTPYPTNSPLGGGPPGWEGSTCTFACMDYANQKTCGGKNTKNCEKDSDCGDGTVKCKYKLPNPEDRVAFCKKNFRLDDWGGGPKGASGGCTTDSEALKTPWGKGGRQYTVCRTCPTSGLSAGEFQCDEGGKIVRCS